VDRKGRLWGTADPGYWLPLDLRRPRKSQLVVLHLDARVEPAFTPTDSERVEAIVNERIGEG
jgi:hypothetical protein